MAVMWEIMTVSLWGLTMVVTLVEPMVDSRAIAKAVHLAAVREMN